MRERFGIMLRTTASWLRAIPGNRWFVPAAGILTGISLFLLGFYLGIRSIPVAPMPATTVSTGPVWLESSATGREQDTVRAEESQNSGARPPEATGLTEKPVTSAGQGQTVQSPAASRTPDEVLSEMASPVEGQTLRTVGWSYWSSFSEWKYHTGVDIAVAAGEPVRCALPGTVEEIRTDIRLGTIIVVSHDAGVATIYGCVKPVEGVSAGKRLERGQIIARVSDSGPFEGDSEPHLHFEVRCGDVLQDPVQYLGTR